MKLRLHREAYPLTFIFLCILIGIIVLVEILFPETGLFHYLFYFACFLGFAFLLAFFRSPGRPTPNDPKQIFSPADGKIVVIEKVFDANHFREERLQVSIFMSPFNVHVNWYPVAGKIKHYEYHPGRYLVAWHPKSSDANERTTIVVETENGKEILIRQVAGAVARRIVCYAKEGKTVSQCEELGFIKFGSRVDLFLPLDTRLNVKLNQKVKGKTTSIGLIE